MKSYSLKDAQQRLDQLIRDAQRGETVLITSDDQQTVQLVPTQQARKPRQPGSAAGLVQMSDDFDAPLPDFDIYTE